MAIIGIVSALKSEAAVFSAINRHGRIQNGLAAHRDKNTAWLFNTVLRIFTVNQHAKLLPGHSCQISDNLILHISGIGADRAYNASQDLIKKGVSILISWGCAGALLPGISPGDLILPELIITRDRTITADIKWHAHFYSTLKKHLNINTGALVQHKNILATPRDKRSLASKYNAVAVDMESGAIAEAACLANIPFLAIRAISDTADMTIPLSATEAADASGQIHTMHLFMKVLKNPVDMPRLFRLALTFNAAKDTLKKVLALTNWTDPQKPLL